MKKRVIFVILLYAKNVVNPTPYGIYDSYLYAKPAVNKNKKRGLARSFKGGKAKQE